MCPPCIQTGDRVHRFLASRPGYGIVRSHFGNLVRCQLNLSYYKHMSESLGGGEPSIYLMFEFTGQYLGSAS